ncbi:MAG: methyl-accepting chemotaxis protein [Planctomycetota bacterium]
MPHSLFHRLYLNLRAVLLMAAVALQLPLFAGAESSEAQWASPSGEAAALASGQGQHATSAHAEASAVLDINKVAKTPEQWAKKLGTSGQFVVPELSVRQRDPFGHEHGQITPIEANFLVEATPYVTYAAWGVVFLVLLGTLAAAWSMGRMRQEDGSIRRSLTLGSKQTLAFGGLTTLLVVIGALAVTAMQSSTRTNQHLAFTAHNVAMVEEIERDLLHLELAAEDFLLTQVDEDLVIFSNCAARMFDRLQHAEKELLKADEREAATLLKEHFLEYESKFLTIVEKVDRFNGIIDTQLVPTGEYLNDLMLATLETAHADRNHRLVLEAAEALDHLALARIHTQIYLRNGNEAEADIARHELQLGAKLLALMSQDVRGDLQKAWMSQAEQGYRFYAEEFQIAVSLLLEREAMVENVLHKLGKKIDQEGLALIEELHHDQAVLLEEADRNAASMMNLVSGVAGTAVVFAVVVSLFLIRSLVGSTRRVLKVLAAVAQGDLTQEPIAMKASDEMGELARATDQMAGSLKEIIRDVTFSAQEVAMASGEIAESSDEIAQGMNEQTTQVQQVSAAVEQMSCSVTEVARKSTDAAASADKSGNAAREGGEIVRDTIDGMQAISEAVSASASSVQELGKRGEQIGEIIATINDIADQTNLLALNAAIEAARAGEHGRGFAVVADEVRKLADRTTQATDEIGNSIQEIQTETTEAVGRMNAGTEQVTHGVAKASAAGESLSEIVSSAQDVAEMIQSIASAADQQSTASDDVARSIETISAVSQRTSERGQQAAQTAALLSQKAEALQTVCRRFKL